MVFRQAAGLTGLGLHLRGVCSFVTIVSSVYAVVPLSIESSGCSVSPELDQISIVVSSTDDSVVPSFVDSVASLSVDESVPVTSEEAVCSVALDASVPELLSVVSVCDKSVDDVLSSSVSVEDVLSVNPSLLVDKISEDIENETVESLLALDSVDEPCVDESTLESSVIEEDAEN